MVSGQTERNILVINFGNLYISHGIYADQLSDALSPYSELWSFLRSLKDHPVDFPGNTVRSLYFPAMKEGFLKLNRRVNPYFRKFSNSLSTARNNKGLIHYGAPSFPIDNSLDNVVTIHDLMALSETNDASKTEQKSLRYFLRMKNIITVSQTSKREIENTGCEGRVDVVYPPTRKEIHPLESKGNLRVELGLPMNKTLLLSVSNSQTRKNLSIVKELTNLLPDSYRIVRIGEGFANTINFKNVDTITLNKIFNSCDLLLMPSILEGFGSPLAEALTVGLPAVASDIEVFRELGGKSVVYFDPGDVHNLRKAIDEAIANKEQFITSGLELSKKFSFETFRDNIRTYYKDKFGFEY